MSKYLYYPGCSMESSARAYGESLAVIAARLDLMLEEIHDWNCCGATEYVGITVTPAYALIARNLALAQAQSNGTKTVLAACSACYLNLSKCDHFMAERPSLGEKVNHALAAGGLSYKPASLEIRHLLDIIVHDIGLDRVRAEVKKPLQGLRVAPYLGCMVPRPDYRGRWSDHEHPRELDLLLEALGAEVIDFPLKTHCCGGHMTQIGPTTAYELIRRLVSSADRYKADIIATVCPMCQLNLDAYQAETNRHFHQDYKMPVVFFTQLMGLAFGAEAKALGFGREIVSANAALLRVGAAPPEAEKPAPRRATKTAGLPMPRMKGDGHEEVSK